MVIFISKYQAVIYEKKNISKWRQHGVTLDTFLGAIPDTFRGVRFRPVLTEVFHKLENGTICSWKQNIGKIDCIPVVL